ncbi:hypothetical protein MOMA_02660 [Moraxella macacae 0408225]|uniref:Fido domain-containing protein n=1 Tax=Moraxella macacae 0408225 TaxID=1230338 RepID=L2F930_9GAMM|nr:Fic family protein [Moraxella macacae]ELA09271.1 hypothetical protein MOMA_02660 [Moraxella macacae 0408225]
MKTAISYNPTKLIYKPIFTKEQLDYLEALNNCSNVKHLFIKRNIEAFAIDFAHTSAMLEGNTYSAIETEILLTTGKTVPKKFEEALMLKNMHKAFDYLLLEASCDNEIPFEYLVKNLHTQVSQRLLDENDCGVVRTVPVLISATNYIPSTISQQLQAGLQFIAKEYAKITNAFEKAVYMHQNLCYLQYFLDHNKRTARNMTAFTLIKSGKMPVMFTEKNANEYVNSVLAYYESENSNYQPFATYFIGAYEKVCSRMNINAIAQATDMLKKNKTLNANS